MGDWPTVPPRPVVDRRPTPGALVLCCAVVFAASQLALVWWLLSHGVISNVPPLLLAVGSVSFTAAILLTRYGGKP